LLEEKAARSHRTAAWPGWSHSRRADRRCSTAVECPRRPAVWRASFVLLPIAPYSTC